MIAIPPSHPRAKSLRTRETLVSGYNKGIVVPEGLIAHGRGEAFDYFIGERTTGVANCAIVAATASLLIARMPVISVNGNAAALCASEIVALAEEIKAKIEVNLFYRTLQREQNIEKELISHGAKIVYGVGERASATIPELTSERRRVDPEGILVADTIFVPLEDGDRTEALTKMGKTVIALDLNPLSRTATKAHITIVDNLVRALPLMVECARALKKRREDLQAIVSSFDNNKNLADSLALMRRGIH